MEPIAIRTYTDFGMKRIEIYPYGDKGFQPHIAVDFAHYDSQDGHYVVQEYGEITFSIGMTRSNVDEARRFADCMQYAIEAAEREPQSDWPSALAQAFQLLK